MRKILLVLCIFFVISGCGREEKKEEDNKQKVDYKIDTVEIQNCETSVSEYYSNGSERVYLVCLDDVRLLDENMSLLSYLESGHTIDEFSDKLSSMLVIHSKLLDGGTSVYRDTGTVLHTKNGITFIRCNNSDGTKDIYIGKNDLDEDWGFENGFCGHNLTNEEI